MTAVAALPRTLQERLETADTIRVDASFEEYLIFAEQCEYRVEYSNHQIVAQNMPTDIHELICGNAIWIAKTVLLKETNFLVYGSNLGIYIPTLKVQYKPDAVVLAEEPQYILHKVKKYTFRSIINPYAVVEVFSDGTIHYDQTEKLPNYKQCPSLQQIFYIHQHTPLVTVYTRTPNPNQWLSEDFIDLNASISFAGKEITLAQLYHQVLFSDKPPHPAR